MKRYGYRSFRMLINYPSTNQKSRQILLEVLQPLFLYCKLNKIDVPEFHLDTQSMQIEAPKEPTHRKESSNSLQIYANKHLWLLEDINTTIGNGASFMVIATVNSNLTAIKQGIKAGANIKDNCNWQGGTWTYVSLACFFSTIQTLIFFLDKKIPLTATPDWPPLLDCVNPTDLMPKYTKLDLVVKARLLLDKGRADANFKSRDTEQSSLLHFLVMNKNKNITIEEITALIKILSKFGGADVNAKNIRHTVLEAAIFAKNHLKIIRTLLDCKARCDTEPYPFMTLMTFAVMNHANLEIIPLLLSGKGAKTDGITIPQIIMSGYPNYFKAIEKLIECGFTCDPSHRDRPILAFVIWSNKLDLIPLLMSVRLIRLSTSLCLNINVKSKTNKDSLLHLAVKAGNLEAIPILVQAGISVKLKTRGGWTAMHLAAALNRVDMIQCLHANGISPSTKTPKRHETPAQLAGRLGNQSAKEILEAITNNGSVDCYVTAREVYFTYGGHKLNKAVTSSMPKMTSGHSQEALQLLYTRFTEFVELNKLSILPKIQNIITIMKDAIFNLELPIKELTNKANKNEHTLLYTGSITHIVIVCLTKHKNYHTAKFVERGYFLGFNGAATKDTKRAAISSITVEPKHLTWFIEQLRLANTKEGEDAAKILFDTIPLKTRNQVYMKAIEYLDWSF